MGGYSSYPYEQRTLICFAKPKSGFRSSLYTVACPVYLLTGSEKPLETQVGFVELIGEDYKGVYLIKVYCQLRGK